VTRQSSHSPAKGSRKGLLIVFSRNERASSARTLRNISTGIDLEDNSVVFIDDYSNDGTAEFLIESQKYGLIDSRIVILSKLHTDEPGIRGCIKKALVNRTSDFVIPLPGHFMFDAHEVNKVIDASSRTRVVIGCRSNLFQTRPIGKYLASKVFGFMFRKISGIKEVRDPHGLVSYPKDLLDYAISQTSPHENHVIPIMIAKRTGVQILQIDIRVREDHAAESKNARRPSIPRFSHVLESLRDLRRASRIVSAIGPEKS